MISTTFTSPTVQTGDEGVYLGIEYKFNRSDKSVTLGMESYTQKLLEEFDIRKGSKSCCSYDFMDTDPEGDKIDSKKFASAVSKLISKSCN
jgi:hypothetical protein